ncbi:OmpA family protein [Hymenobacter sp. RP-2-7]|uniref:OmpA family protein n=1 Tax=Hymenobacter polaris TaxID=2682546 RepID=A0A7Y0FM90_9BACT|nr:PA14 domain-containing protein [Hymenobacter polaris]NML65608.1 OmpA family protein [Hymenobacter polaris]
MRRIIVSCLISGLATLGPVAAHAQAVGDGLRGAYYDGMNFEHFIGARLDRTIDFYWPNEQPMRGVPAEQFTVRWTGWLVPPTTGHYVLHLAVDDGARLWLDGQQVLDEWRGQPLSYFDVPLELEAGHPYRLRLDYCQYSLSARALLIWERPRHTETLSSWRNLWGLTEAPIPFTKRIQETIPTRYLFSHMPAPPKLTVALANVAVVAKQPLPPALLVTAPAPAPPSSARPPRIALKPRVVARRHRTPVASSPRRADTLAAHLARGQALTLRALYFEQGKADLPAPVQASLDTLAQALGHYPRLRLEVQGHTDNQGDPELNRQLSQRRAEAVCQYLAARGVATARLQPLGLGGTQPVADNNLPAERPRNRRVVLRPLP